jgi:hypothetical protein
VLPDWPGHAVRCSLIGQDMPFSALFWSDMPCNTTQCPCPCARLAGLLAGQYCHYHYHEPCGPAHSCRRVFLCGMCSSAIAEFGGRASCPTKEALLLAQLRPTGLLAGQYCHYHEPCGPAHAVGYSFVACAHQPLPSSAGEQAARQKRPCFWHNYVLRACVQETAPLTRSASFP